MIFKEKSKIIFTNRSMVCNSSGDMCTQQVGIPNVFKLSIFF